MFFLPLTLCVNVTSPLLARMLTRVTPGDHDRRRSNGDRQAASGVDGSWSHDKFEETVRSCAAKMISSSSIFFLPCAFSLLARHPPTTCLRVNVAGVAQGPSASPAPPLLRPPRRPQLESRRAGGRRQLEAGPRADSGAGRERRERVGALAARPPALPRRHRPSAGQRQRRCPRRSRFPRRPDQRREAWG